MQTAHDTDPKNDNQWQGWMQQKGEKGLISSV